MKQIKEQIRYFYNKIKIDKFWNNLVKNSFWAFFGDAIAAAIGLFITIILIRLIGSEAYGILVLAQTYMTIVDTSLNIQSWKSVIQYGQKSIINNDEESLRGYIKLGSVLDISTSILGGIVALILAPIIGKIFNWSNELIICSQIFSITIFSHFSGTPTAILRILNKFNLVALQKFLAAIIKFVSLITILIVKNSIGVIEATIIYCLTDIIANLILVIFAFTIYFKKYGYKNILKNNKVKEKKEFIKFTLWVTLGEIVDIPVNYFDVFIISLLGTNSVAVFKVFKQCVAILQKVTSPIQQSILPQFSELTAKGEKQRGYNIVIKIRNIILKIIGPIALLIGISSPLWLKLLYGEIYSNNWYILCIYLLVQTFALSYTTVHPYFLSLNKAKYSTIYVLLANLVYCILAYILVNKFDMIGIVIAYFIQCFIVIKLKVNDIKKENVKEEKNGEN